MTGTTLSGSARHADAGALAAIRERIERPASSNSTTRV